MKDVLDRIKNELESVLGVGTVSKNAYARLNALHTFVLDQIILQEDRNAQQQKHKALNEHIAELTFLTDNFAVDTLNAYNPITSEASKLVFSDRNADYGHPADDFIRTAAMWSALLGSEIEPRFVPMFMICVKLSRESNHPKRDNCVDIAGYAETLEWMKHELEKRK